MSLILLLSSFNLPKDLAEIIIDYGFPLIKDYRGKYSLGSAITGPRYYGKTSRINEFGLVISIFKDAMSTYWYLREKNRHEENKQKIPEDIYYIALRLRFGIGKFGEYETSYEVVDQCNTDNRHWNGKLRCWNEDEIFEFEDPDRCVRLKLSKSTANDYGNIKDATWVGLKKEDGDWVSREYRAGKPNKKRKFMMIEVD